MAKSQYLPAIALLISLLSVYIHFTYGEAAIAQSAAVELARR